MSGLRRAAAATAAQAGVWKKKDWGLSQKACLVAYHFNMTCPFSSWIVLLGPWIVVFRHEPTWRLSSHSISMYLRPQTSDLSTQTSALSPQSYLFIPDTRSQRHCAVKEPSRTKIYYAIFVIFLRWAFVINIEDTVKMINFVLQKGCRAVVCNKCFFRIFWGSIGYRWVLRACDRITMMSWQWQAIFAIWICSALFLYFRVNQYFDFSIPQNNSPQV